MWHAPDCWVGKGPDEQSKNETCANETSENESPSKLKFQKQMQMALHDSDIEKTKIMSYRNKAPTPSEAHQNGLKVLYSQTKSPVPNTARHIPQAPDRILDAPDIV